MISAFVITCNSERYLRRCLNSISFVDEIIIVDSNSTDSTLSIAKEFGAKVFTMDFHNFSEKKEFARTQCSYEWILNLDADEYLPQETAEEIKMAVQDERYDSYLIPFKTFFKDREIRWGRHRNESHIRLFKRDLRFNRVSVHEKIVGARNTGRIKNPIIHTPYEDFSDIRERTYRNATLAAQDKAEVNILLLLVFTIFNPLFRFIKEYIFCLGLLDGILGLCLAYQSSKEVFLKYSLAIKMKYFG